MGNRIRWTVFIFLVCLPLTNISAQFKNVLDSLLLSDTSAIVRKVLANPGRYRLQIIYSQTDYSKKNPVLQEFSYRFRPEEYFYPASLVKLPASALALEKLRALKLDWLDRDLPLYTNPKYSGLNLDSIRYPSLADDIKQMMVVSDNYAYNRVYDFLGQEYAHLRLFQKGYTNTRLIQRMSPASEEENRHTGPFAFLDTCKNVLYSEEELITQKIFSNPAEKLMVGKAYYVGRKKIREPKDFSSNNFLPLHDAHQMLVSIIYPGFLQKTSQFELTEEDYVFLRKIMSMYPRESGVKLWQNDTTYYDCFRKMLYYGDYHGRADSTIRIFNKIGMAYGFMSDVAYFVDYKNKVEFFLSAVLYVNEDEVLNDGRYDYNSIGYPFMERLGKLVYQYELTRKEASRNKKLVPMVY
ncbi:MAG TPA: serine hydrolase [Cytophagaceae bacterium]|nr:serine hydrolase [Cytophagaceae bacterium]